MPTDHPDPVFQVPPPPDYPDYGAIGLQLDGSVAVVTLGADSDRAIPTTTMTPELTEFFGLVRNDHRVKAIVITGRGKYFSSGGDVSTMVERARQTDPRGNPNWVRRLPVDESVDFITNMLDVDVPIIAAVNGHAVGAGLRILMFCDYAVAAQHARLGDTHVNRGLVAPQASILAEMIGIRRAKSMTLTGQLISASKAADWGLVDEVVGGDEVYGRAVEQAQAMAALPPLAIKWTKRALNNRLRRAVADFATEAYALESLTMLSADHAEAAAAFVEKRTPRSYEGK